MSGSDYIWLYWLLPKFIGSPQAPLVPSEAPNGLDDPR